jgi:hypothetical protein
VVPDLDVLRRVADGEGAEQDLTGHTGFGRALPA